jgi:hypothetical protein
MSPKIIFVVWKREMSFVFMEVGMGQDWRTEDGDKDVKVVHCIQATRLGKAETCGESVRQIEEKTSEPPRIRWRLDIEPAVAS